MKSIKVDKVKVIFRRSNKFLLRVSGLQTKILIKGKWITNKDFLLNKNLALVVFLLIATEVHDSQPKFRLQWV